MRLFHSVGFILTTCWLSAAACSGGGSSSGGEGGSGGDSTSSSSGAGDGGGGGSGGQSGGPVFRANLELNRLRSGFQTPEVVRSHRFRVAAETF